MTSESFLYWLKHALVRWLEDQDIVRPILLFVDNYSSHISLAVHHFCKEHEIILITLFPNSTHLLQLLDVSCFGPIINKWTSFLVDKRNKDHSSKLGMSNSGNLCSVFFNDNNFMALAVSGFRRTGLFPWDEDAVDYDQLLEICRLKDQDERRLNSREPADVYVTEQWIGKTFVITVKTRV